MKSNLYSKLYGIVVVMVLAIAVSVPGSVNSVRAHSGDVSIADLTETLLDAVVNISTKQNISGQRSVPLPQLPDDSPFKDFFEDFFENQPGDGDRLRRSQSLGSGFVLDGQEGIIITNNHVIDGADEISVKFNDGTELEAEVVGTDKKTDIAVLKVNPEGPLVDVDFGDSSTARIGESVIAIGNPFGLGGTVTAGIISAQNRDINAGPYDDFIQTDASINRGNSGGPLFNMKGEVIGINTAILSPTGNSVGIGFSIPAETATWVIEQLIEFGETRRGWLGVRIQEVTDEIAESLAMEKAIGALVAGISPDGPAEKAGFETGDVIIKFDGLEVPTMRDLPRMVANTAVGKSVEVLVLRKGEEVTLSVELGRLEESEQSGDSDATVEEEKEEETKDVIGLSLSSITDELREEYKIEEEVNGVLITAVEPGSAAEEKRIGKGDIIVEVAQEAVTSPSEVADQIEKLKGQSRNAALLLLSNSKGDVRFVAVRISE